MKTFKHPLFSHITMEKKYHPHNLTTKLKVCTIYEFDKPKTETQCVTLFNTTIGYREPIDEINFDYWNGCVIIDIDYKNYPNANREDSIKIMKDVYVYL